MECESTKLGTAKPPSPSTSSSADSASPVAMRVILSSPLPYETEPTDMAIGSRLPNRFETCRAFDQGTFSADIGNAPAGRALIISSHCQPSGIPCAALTESIPRMSLVRVEAGRRATCTWECTRCERHTMADERRRPRCGHQCRRRAPRLDGASTSSGRWSRFAMRSPRLTTKEPATTGTSSHEPLGDLICSPGSPSW